MKITLKNADGTHTCRMPYVGCRYVEAIGHDCLVCKDMLALVDKISGRVLALAPKSHLEEAKKDFPKAKVERYQGPLRARMPNYTTNHDTYEGDALCTRCRRVAGRLIVKVDTLFGIEEDRAVLVNGRPRVY